MPSVASHNLSARCFVRPRPAHSAPASTSAAWSRRAPQPRLARAGAVHAPAGGVEPASRHGPCSLEACTLPSGLVDFYALLEVDPAASAAQVKAAYRAKQKVCHPDILGDDLGHSLCIVLNEAYSVLVNPSLRSLYDVDLQESRWEEEQQGHFTGRPLSEWLPSSAPARARNADPAENRAVFVDECTCIGCKQCVWNAPATFEMEETHGRSRARRQWADCEDDLQAAIDSCPVDCIHWVQREELPVLEHVMASVPRTAVGIMQSGSVPTSDVFTAAAAFQKHEDERRVAHAAWKRAYEYTQEQEVAMQRASGNPFARPFQYAGAGLDTLGRLMARLMQGLRVVRGADGRGDAAGGASVPLRRALVRVQPDKARRWR